MVSRKKLAQDKAEKSLSILKGALDYSEFRDVDMVIEVHGLAYIAILNYLIIEFVHLLPFYDIQFIT